MMDKVDADAEFFGPRRASIWPIAAEEAAARFPEAMVVFDWQCSHLVERGDIILTTNKRGRLSAERADRPYGEPRIHWHPQTQVWVRYSVAVRPLTTGLTQTCDVCRWEFSLYAFELLKWSNPNIPDWSKERRTTCMACVRKLHARAKQWHPMPRDWGSRLVCSDEERMKAWLERGGY